MGSIHLEGIEVVARIGLLEEEQHAPQDLYVTVDLAYDFAKVRESDDLAEGIDYREVIACVKKFASTYDGKMLERFAHLMAEKLKEEFPVEKVRLAVDKPRYTRKLGLREIRVQVER
ncbi:uncharacterized protein METZ01_LOCUS349652 [marine metagenome]|uniref:dihydroneopterin aldolase n=1 Tax=marine metagenome TaxID=408172 RepID=A0A382RIJ3_9ZZZZ